jgi:hypothetical protein
MEIDDCNEMVVAFDFGSAVVGIDESYCSEGHSGQLVFAEERTESEAWRLDL